MHTHASTPTKTATKLPKKKKHPQMPKTTATWAVLPPGDPGNSPEVQSIFSLYMVQSNSPLTHLKKRNNWENSEISHTRAQQKYLVFSLVYKLIELALILPVSTTSIERVFSTMKIIKSELRNKINDVWFNDLMIYYIEREIFKSLDDVDIIRTFTGNGINLLILFSTLLTSYISYLLFQIALLLTK